MAEYNSAHTGPEIDAAVSAVKTKQSTWDNKQDKITGKAGQVVGFDASGNPIAQEAPSGGASSWNDLKDKPVILEGGDTLTWDGNTEGLVGSANMFYKVSAVVPTMSDFANGATINLSDGGQMALSAGDIVDLSAEGVNVIVISELCFIALEDNIVNFDFPFPEKGIYFFRYGELFTSSLTIPGYTGFATEKLDPAYLPKHTHSWNDLADKPGVAALYTDGTYLYSDSTLADKISCERLYEKVNAAQKIVVTMDGETFFFPLTVAKYGDCAMLSVGTVQTNGMVEGMSVYTAEYTA